MLALSAVTPDTASVASASTVFAILASAVIVLGGLAALVRAIWKTANIMRDNTTATKDLTRRMDDLVTSVDGRFDQLVHRVDTQAQQIDGLRRQMGHAQQGGTPP
jgi:predicted PurR-regulated permease PerM